MPVIDVLNRVRVLGAKVVSVATKGVIFAIHVPGGGFAVGIQRLIGKVGQPAIVVPRDVFVLKVMFSVVFAQSVAVNSGIWRPQARRGTS